MWSKKLDYGTRAAAPTNYFRTTPALLELSITIPCTTVTSWAEVIISRVHQHHILCHKDSDSIYFSLELLSQ